MKTAITFLIFYTFFLTVLLYGLGTAYDVSGIITIDIPVFPESTDIVSITLYGFKYAYEILSPLWEIPTSAFTTITLIANDYPMLAVAVMLPATISMLIIIVDWVRVIRGA